MQTKLIQGASSITPPNRGVLLLEFSHENSPRVGGTVLLIDFETQAVASIKQHGSSIVERDGTIRRFEPGQVVTADVWQSAAADGTLANGFSALTLLPELSLAWAEACEQIQIVRQPDSGGGVKIFLEYADHSHQRDNRDAVAVLQLNESGSVTHHFGEPVATTRFRSDIGEIEIIVPARPQMLSQVRYIPDGSLRDVQFVSHWNENYAAEVNNKLFGEVFEHHTPGEPFDTSTSSPLGSAALIVGSLLALLAIIGLIRKARG